MKIKEIIQLIEELAPLSYQESYDNAGLIIGDKNHKITGVLICLDSTEDVVQEAIDKKCNLIIAHHPIVFSGLKKFNGKNYIKRTVIKAIKNDVAIYAAHTNIDNVLGGVNFKIAEKLGLKNVRILAPKTGLLNKLVVFCPVSHVDKVRNVLFENGAGSIGNYSECSFNSNGTGTFKANKEATPFVGEINKLQVESEVKIEVVVESFLINQIVENMLHVHPYEEVAYDIYEMQNTHQVGSGVVGDLEVPINEMEFLNQLKKIFKAEGICYTPLRNKKIEKVALCGGSGSFLLNAAIKAGADIFISADFKYHQFFDAEGKIVVADIGHYESEQFTSEIFYEILTKKITNFAVRLSEINTNPINYL
ncbi:MAG: Nif3-like dinuclear metal center hexameric protein [Bacteroidetes bacterium]|nr:Nif3-like dinuclear metal center hexameric protein [Bacteroidota bacterium]